MNATVDQNELRVNSALVVAALGAAWISKRWELVALQAAVLFLTALKEGLGPYVLLYRLVLRPLGIVRPDLRFDHPEPHRFAALFGAVVASVATCLLATGKSAAGWGTVALLACLASVGFSGWCAGCFTYYLMNRLGLGRLFRHPPVAGTFPGARPPKLTKQKQAAPKSQNFLAL